jgi:hypothetical protein
MKLLIGLLLLPITAGALVAGHRGFSYCGGYGK